jgi:AraC-like DNA-binding protein
MKHRTKNALRGMAKHLGLQVKFVHYLPQDVHGKLLPREKRILINAHKPRHEHIFTVLHEIGHFVQHVLNKNRIHHPRIFDIRWNIEFLSNLFSKGRRYFRYMFNKESGKEWEADLWAMCAFVYLAKVIGCRDDLSVFLNHHPEKMWTYRLAAVATWYSEIKIRFVNAYKILKEAKQLS